MFVKKYILLVIFPILFTCIPFVICEVTKIVHVNTCPAEQDTNAWNNRAMEHCGLTNKNHYHCLEDESSAKDGFFEFCASAIRIGKGKYPTYNPTRKEIVIRDCPPTLFQSRDVSSYQLNKCNTKMLCDDTGQMPCNDGNVTHDRLCMCNYTHGYARNDYHSDNPNKTEICCPLDIPCKCSIPDQKCGTGLELNAASQCVEVCQVGYHRPFKELDCVQISGSVTVLRTTPSSESSSHSTPGDDTENNSNIDQPSDNRIPVYVYIIIGVVLLVIGLIIAFVVLRRYPCCSEARDSNDDKSKTDGIAVKEKDGRNGTENVQGNNVYYYNIKAEHVQIGDQATAIRNEAGPCNKPMGEGGASYLEECDKESNSSNNSEFKGFPRNQNVQKVGKSDSLKSDSSQKTKTPKGTMEKKSFKESYKENMKALERAAAERDLSVYDVPGDGNCMYNSVLMQITCLKPDLTVDDMRKHVQKFLESNPSTPSDVLYKDLLSALEWRPGTKSKQCGEYIKLQHNKQVEESQKKELLFQMYLNEVRENEWGDPFTLHALSQIYQVEIQVLSSRNLSNFTKTSVVNDPKLTVTLGHLAVNGEDLHYVSLLPEPIDSDVDVKLDLDISQTNNEDTDMTHTGSGVNTPPEEVAVSEPLLNS